MATAATSEAPTNESAVASVSSVSEVDEAYSEEVSSGDWFTFLTLMAVFGVTGVVGNSLLLAVFVHRLRRAASGGSGSVQQHGQQYNYFTAALALADLFVCAVVVPYTAAFSGRIIVDDDACKAMQYVYSVSLIFSILVLVGIAIERYHAVCRPTRPFTSRHAWILIGIIAALALFVALPNYLTSSVTAVDGRLVGCHFATGTQPGRTFAAVLTALFIVTLAIMFSLYCLVFRVIYRRESGGGPSTAADNGAGGKVVSQPLSSESRSTGMQDTGFSNVPTQSGSAAVKPFAPHYGRRTSTELQQKQTQQQQQSPEQQQLLLIPRDSDAEVVLNVETLRQDVSGEAESKPAASTPHASQSLHHSRSITRVVWMLFGVTVVFFISWMPYFLTNLRVVPYSLTFQYLNYFNNCTNFIVYGICNRKIRKEMINRLRCR